MSVLWNWFVLVTGVLVFVALGVLLEKGAVRARRRRALVVGWVTREQAQAHRARMLSPGMEGFQDWCDDFTPKPIRPDECVNCGYRRSAHNEKEEL